jgi:hypothetical protein
VITFLLMATFIPVTPSSAAGRITIHPSGTVGIGQVIRVTGVGFVPNDEVYVQECFRSSCNIEGAIPARISSNGTLASTHFRLIGYFPKPLQCGSKATSGCYLSVSNAPGSDKATVVINFRRIS